MYFERPWVQAIIYWQVSFFALMLLFVGNPFKDNITNYVEIFSEIIVLLIGYHVCVLTGFNIETERRFSIGISIIILVSLLISVHIVRWLIGFIAEIKIKFMKHKLKKGLKLKLESTMKSMHKVKEEIDENNEHWIQLNSNRGLLNPNPSARLPMKLESIEEERKVEISVNESQEKIDAK